MNPRLIGTYYGTKDLSDMLGRQFVVGDAAAKVTSCGDLLQICTITKIENGRMYADESKSYIRYPGRMLIVTEQLKLTALVINGGSNVPTI